MFEEKKINLSGFTLAFKMWHAQNKRPVLCLHGKLDNAASFDFLAPYLADFQLAALDYPGTGYSSHYPEGVFPHWKSDAFLMIDLIKKLQWEKFDIIGHSLGSLLGTFIAMALPEQVGKLVFLDILGPKIDFVENRAEYLRKDLATFLTYREKPRTLYPDQETAIKDRMKIGNISHQAAKALVNRGMKKIENNWVWTFDQRLHCVGSTVPYEDEIRAMFNGIEAPVCLIRADKGIDYPAELFQSRAKAIKNLSIHEVTGGHHVHMDDPEPVAKIIAEFLKA